MIRAVPIWLVGSIIGVATPATVAAQTSLTFGRDIFPIVQAHCVSCHHEGGDAPFSLSTYGDVRRRATQIAEVTTRRYMPPWMPDPGPDAFVGERRLDDRQIDTIRQWVAAGAPEGTPLEVSHSPAASPSDWTLGPPDLILRLPDYELDAEGGNVFRNFVIGVPPHSGRFVRALQFRPGSRAVHHANIRIDPTPASRQLDDADPTPGYEGVILHSASYPEGHFLGWTPGQRASDSTPWRLNASDDLVVQLHMQTTGKPERVHGEIGLYFTDTPPSSVPSIVRLGRQRLDIPPADAAYSVTDSFVLPVEAQAIAVQPHAHYRASEIRATAILPDGSSHELIHIRHWDFSWQDQYRYARPFWLPAGTTLQTEYVFDNSAANPRNPDRPPRRVEWGWRTEDEMGDVWIQFLTRNDTDRERLDRDVRWKMLTEDAVGCEVLLTREPEHVNLRNDAGLIYMELGQPARAVVHFHAVTVKQPGSASAWFNEGVALQAANFLAEAALRYTQALRLNPRYSAAHNNLGNVWLAQGRDADAREQYRLAVDADSRNTDARANLALSLLVDRQTEAGLSEIAEVLRQDGSRLPRLTPAIWLLVAHTDPGARRPQQGLHLAEQIVEATHRRDPGALDALAAGYAAVSRFDVAEATAREAIALLPQDQAQSEQRKDIDSRIALYRQGKPFVLER